MPFGINPISADGQPSVASGRKPEFIQFRFNGQDLGGPDATVLDFVGQGWAASEDGGVISVTASGVTLPLLVFANPGESVPPLTTSYPTPPATVFNIIDEALTELTQVLGHFYIQDTYLDMTGHSVVWTMDYTNLNTLATVHRSGTALSFGNSSMEVETFTGANRGHGRFNGRFINNVSHRIDVSCKLDGVQSNTIRMEMQFFGTNFRYNAVYAYL